MPKIKMLETAGHPNGALLRGFVYDVDSKTAKKYISAKAAVKAGKEDIEEAEVQDAPTDPAEEKKKGKGKNKAEKAVK